MKITIRPDLLDQVVAHDAFRAAWYIGKEFGDRIALITIKAHPYAASNMSGLEFRVICDVPSWEPFEKPTQITVILILEEERNVFSIAYLGEGQSVPTFIKHAQRYPEDTKLPTNPRVQVVLLEEAIYLAHLLFAQNLETRGQKVLADLHIPEGLILPRRGTFSPKSPHGLF